MPEQRSGLTVGDLQHGLLDLPPTYGDHPTRDALVQITADGETFYVIDWIDDLGEGGVVLQIVPMYPDDDGETGGPQ